ncbi:hypothetical protein [Aeromonas caviae]|uniref:hypothetical protein n=2 Tax=Aeromonas caviae TaxID=648 RepID=UPI00244CD66D|nr:hypothetical protein [Aeromonas caviae]MDH0237945.1 hypothetical protein [Aeromonas caviae]
MKRYDLELTATGPVMEERKEGAFVPFSEVDLLKHHINQYQEERSSTGMAISNAILSGIVPEQHPLRSRLELLANHHKREQALAELLRRARRYVSPLSCPESEIQIVQSIVSSIDSVLAGQLPDPAVTVTETIRTAPERIWLQVGDQSHYHSEPFPSDTSEVSWCHDSVTGCEVPYVRADLACQAPLHSSDQRLLDWAVTSWHEQVAHRPMENVYRRTLDSVWRQVIRFAGEDPHSIIGPSHDDLLYPEQVQKGGEPCDSASPSSSPD